MSHELRRRNNGASVVLVPDSRSADCGRNRNGNRKSIATFTPPYNRTSVLKDMGHVIYVTPALLEQAVSDKRVGIEHDSRRFLKTRAVLSNAWAMVKGVFRG